MADERKYGKYTDLFCELQPEQGHDEPYYAQPFAYFKGDKDVPGAKYRLGLRVIKAPCTLEEEPHFHREEQYYFFLGSKIPDVFSSWDAEIEFYMGESPDKMELIRITKPTVIHVPAGMWHGPVVFKRVDKPVFLEDPQFAGQPGAIKLRRDSDVNDFLLFDGGEY